MPLIGDKRRKWVRMGLRDLVYRVYERRLEASLSGHSVPRHVGVILDGNRRWARLAGLTDVSRRPPEGRRPHLRAARLVPPGRGRGGHPVAAVHRQPGPAVRRGGGRCCGSSRAPSGSLVDAGWHVKPVGALDLLPAETAQVLKDAGEATAATPGLLVNVAIGYGGRREIADAVRSLLQDHATKGTTIEELAEVLDVEHIAEHLYTAGQPDPDLVIRTSGEQRLGGFLLWQSAHSEFYFCDAYWPDFRRVDFLRALRSYAARQRRFGS